MCKNHLYLTIILVQLLIVTWMGDVYGQDNDPQCLDESIFNFEEWDISSSQNTMIRNNCLRFTPIVENQQLEITLTDIQNNNTTNNKIKLHCDIQNEGGRNPEIQLYKNGTILLKTIRITESIVIDIGDATSLTYKVIGDQEDIINICKCPSDDDFAIATETRSVGPKTTPQATYFIRDLITTASYCVDETADAPPLHQVTEAEVSITKQSNPNIGFQQSLLFNSTPVEFYYSENNNSLQNRLQLGVNLNAYQNHLPARINFDYTITVEKTSPSCNSIKTITFSECLYIEDSGWATDCYQAPLDGKTNFLRFSNPSLNINIYPNPSSSYFQITYTLAEAKLISLKILNYQGQLLQIIQNQAYMTKGIHHQSIDLSTLVDGLYFLEFDNGKQKTYHHLAKH